MSGSIDRRRCPSITSSTPSSRSRAKIASANPTSSNTPRRALRCRSGWVRQFFGCSCRSPARTRRSSTTRSRISGIVIASSIARAMTHTAAGSVRAERRHHGSGLDQGRDDQLQLTRRREALGLARIGHVRHGFGPALETRLGASSILQPVLRVALGDLDLLTHPSARDRLIELLEERLELRGRASRRVAAFGSCTEIR